MAGSGSAGLTGVWDGQYSYPRRFPPVPFTAVILQAGQLISGTVHEKPTEGWSAGQTLYATIEGDQAGSAVCFTKLYDPQPKAYRRPIRYEGMLSADGNEIEGQWTIPGSWSGKFLMIRSGPPWASAEAREQISEPAL